MGKDEQISRNSAVSLTTEQTSTPTPRNQISTKTAPGRGREMIVNLAAHLAGQGREQADLRILSFGCSTGEECVTLAEEIPQAHVFGAEIDVAALARAQELQGPRLTVFQSTRANLDRHAPFDAVLAMNVLCRYPQTEGSEDISPIYPFALWDETVSMLWGLLRPGGFLLVFNSQYLLVDASVGPSLQAMPPAVSRSGGWINKFDRNGRRLTETKVHSDGREYGFVEWEKLSRADPVLSVAPNRMRGVVQAWLPGRARSDVSLQTSLWQKV